MPGSRLTIVFFDSIPDGIKGRIARLAQGDIIGNTYLPTACDIEAGTDIGTQAGFLQLERVFHTIRIPLELVVADVEAELRTCCKIYTSIAAESDSKMEVEGHENALHFDVLVVDLGTLLVVETCDVDAKATHGEFYLQ